MVVCFLCDKKLNGKCAQVCSSITPYSNVPYPEKIAEFIGDEVVVIVTTADHMCKKCTALLNHMDKLGNDMKLVKNAMFSCIQKKYGKFHLCQDVEIVNKLKAEDKLKQSQHKVPSGLRVSPTVTTAAVLTPVQTPLKLLKTQQQQQQQPTSRQESANKIKLYKCSFCGFQSKDLGRVRFHLRTHVNNKKPKKPILNQAVANALTTERETEDSCLVKTKFMKPEPSKIQENNHQADSMDIDENQKDNNKGTVNMDMMLNDYVPTEGSTYVRQEKDTENSQNCKTVKEAKWKIKPEPAQEEKERETEDSCLVTTKFMKPEPSKTQENNHQADSMDIDEYQKYNNRGTVNMDMMLNDYVLTEGSAYIKQEKDTEYSQNYKTVKEAKWKIKHEPAQEEKERETEDSCLVTTKFMKPEPSKTQENNHQADSMDIDEYQKYYNRGTVNMDMMLNYYVPTEGSAYYVKQEKDTENSQNYKTVQEAKWKIKPEPAQEETTDEEIEDTTDA